MSDLLEIENLRVRYPDGTAALHGVSLSVGAGEKVGLVGPNGAGKTTLLLAVLRGVEAEGRIAVDGVEVSRRTAPDARDRCGMLFQDADDQLFMPSLLEDAAFGPLNQGLAAGEAQERALAAIAAVGLEGLDGRSAHHLSGGQKRSAALATVLAMRVTLLLLDEPASNLDHRSRGRLIDLLGGRGEAMLLASHDLDMIRRLCSRVVLLSEGLVAAAGPAETILADAALLSRHGLA